jgi:hypothetical protein
MRRIGDNYAVRPGGRLDARRNIRSIAKYFGALADTHANHYLT